VAAYAGEFIRIRAWGILSALVGYVAAGTYRGVKDTVTPLQVRGARAGGRVGGAALAPSSWVRTGSGRAKACPLRGRLAAPRTAGQPTSPRAGRGGRDHVQPGAECALHLRCAGARLAAPTARCRRAVWGLLACRSRPAPQSLTRPPCTPPPVLAQVSTWASQAPRWGPRSRAGCLRPCWSACSSKSGFCGPRTR
jgi:hypothetical protein